MRSLYDYIVESKIFEGGHAVTANPIPAYITPLIYKDIEDLVHSKFGKVKMVPLGSVGKKKDDDFNGDIDVAIDIPDKNKGREMLKELFPDNEMVDGAGNIISVSYPYNKEGKTGNAQVDFMFTHNIDWAKWRWQSPDRKNGESKYKGDARVFLIQFAIHNIPVKDAKDEYLEDGKTVKKHWKYTFNQEGVFLDLIDFTSKKDPNKVVKNGKRVDDVRKLIYNDPVNVMKFMYGDNYDNKYFSSVEGVWKGIHSKDFMFPDAVPAIEKEFYERYIDNPRSAEKLDPKDFSCQYYKPEEK